MRQLCDLIFSSRDLSWPDGSSRIPAFSDTAIHRIHQESGVHRKQESSCQRQDSDCDIASKNTCDTKIDTVGTVDTVNALNTLDTLATTSRVCEGHVHCDCDMVDIAASVCIQYDLHLSPLQISRLLVVEPEKRLTAKDALAHPFFKREEVITAADLNFFCVINIQCQLLFHALSQ